MKLLPCIVAALALLASPALAKTFHISGPNDPQWTTRVRGIPQAMANAEGGDTIVLGSGEYPMIASLVGKTGAGVTIKPAAGAKVEVKGATFNAGGWSLVADEAPGAGTMTLTAPVQIGNADGIRLEGLEIVGTTDPAADLTELKGAAIIYRNATNLSIVRCKIHHWATALTGLHAKNLTVTDNVFSYTSSDLVHIGGNLSDAQIGRNLFTLVHSKDLVHQDGLQIFAVFADKPLDHITIFDNRFIRGKGGAPVQGIFLQGTPVIPISNLIVRGNMIMEGNFWAIGLAFGQDFLVENNYWGGYTDAKNGAQTMVPWAKFLACKNGMIRGNFGTAGPIINTSDTDIKIVNHKTVKLSPPDDLTNAEAWWAAKPVVAPGASAAS